MAHRGSVAARHCTNSWRALRTAAAFAIFGVGAVALVLAVLPLTRLLASRGGAELRAQQVIHRAFAVFVWIMTALGLIHVMWHGRRRLQEGGSRVIVANHPTLIDVVVIIAVLPQADCVVKSAAWCNPFMRGILRAAGYMSNDGGEAILNGALARLRAGRRLLLFPEGTRSPQAGLGPFHRGAARVALASGCDIVPVVIRCEPPTLTKSQRWFHVPDRTVHITLDVHPPLSPQAYAEETGRAARRMTDDLRNIFHQERTYVPS